jgi:hypothetical protein
MNPWCALAASLVCITALGSGCSGDSSNGPVGQAGQAGASAGSGAQSGSSSQAGKSPTAGNAGVPAGGSPSAGTAGTAGGPTDAGAPGAGEGGSAGEPTSGPYRAKVGELCPVEETIGVVELWNGTPLSVQVFLYDRLDPWVTEAELTNSTCGFHRYTPGACAACNTGQVCSLQGQCVPERRTVKDATLQVRTGAQQRQYAADPNLGGIYSELDIGDASSAYAMTLSWAETQVTLEAMPVASGELDELSIATESDEYDMPGALDATWQPPGDAAFVRSRIPINHHAGGPTFTECSALTSAGAFHADADMVNPLAVQTGLEFQGVDHVFIAAAQTPQGCVEFRFGARILAFPN